MSTEIVEFVGGPKCGEVRQFHDLDWYNEIHVARPRELPITAFEATIPEYPEPLVVGVYRRTEEMHKGRVIYRWQGEKIL